MIRLFSYALICFLSLNLSYAQILPETPVAEEAEEPKSIMNIEVKNGLLSVELLDVEIGDVINEIAEKAKFTTEISSDVVHKKISSNFKGVDLEKGISRLLSLIKENDYIFSYNTDGVIDKIEIYGSSRLATPPMLMSRMPRTTQRPPSPTTPPITQPIMGAGPSPIITAPQSTGIISPPSQSVGTIPPPQFKPIAPPIRRQQPTPPQPVTPQEE